MKRAISGLGGLAVSALFIAAPLSIAGAADMAVKAPPPVVVPAPVYSWTGCYIGGNTGGAWAQKTTTLTSFDGDPSDYIPTGSTSADGWAYGGQIGCDYQFNTTWVVGIRGMWDGSTMKGSNIWPTEPEEFNNYKIDSFGTVVGKLGYLVAPTVELYVLGGVAWVHDSLNWTATGAGEFANGSDTRTGYDVGGGLSWMFAPNWDVWIEYDYMGFGTKNLDLAGVGDDAGAYLTANVQQSVEKVLLGIDYRFYWGAAPAAIATKG